MAGDRIIKCAECGTPFVALGSEKAERCPVCERIAPAPGRKRGIVKWYSRGKGYGFITPVEGADVFVHKSGLAADVAPRVGQLVEFAIGHGPRGAQAVEVVILDAPHTGDVAPTPD